MVKCLKIFLSTFLFLFFSLNLSLAQTELTVTINVGDIDTILTLSGRTSPYTQVTIVENGAVIGTTTADSSGNFTKSLLAQTPGIHLISIYSTDKNGLSSSTINYSISLTAYTETTLSNIILPSTISLSGTGIGRGDNLLISGSSVPLSTITLFINNETSGLTVASNGSWQYLFSTVGLSLGSYDVYARTSTSDGYQSEFSTTMTFTINLPPTPTPTKADIASVPTPTPSETLAPTPTSLPLLLPPLVALFDIDQSGRIELGEMFNSIKAWVETWRNPVGMACDLNEDGICNLIDFSILLYYIER